MLNQRQRECRDICKKYLQIAGNLPDAMKIAREDRFTQNTSVWLGALSEILGEQSKQDTRDTEHST